MIKVYGAAKFEKYNYWLEKMMKPSLFPGLDWTMRWPYVAHIVLNEDVHYQDNEDKLLQQEWLHDIEDVRKANILFCYAEKDDQINGALVEIGCALGLGKPVYLIGENDRWLGWKNHPLVTQVPTIEKANSLALIRNREYNNG